MGDRTRLLSLLGLLALGSRGASAQPPVGRFERFSSNQGLSQSTVNVICQDHVGFLWFGTEEGLNRFDGYSFTVFRHDPNRQDSLPEDRVTALFEDHSGRLWVGTWGGLSSLDRRTDTFVRIAAVPTKVSSIAEGPGGRLYVAAEGYGVFERNPTTGAFLPHRPNDHVKSPLGSWIPSALLVDRQGELWVGTKDAGLDRLAKDGDFVHYRPAKDNPGSLSHREVWALAEDPKGHIWVATYGGGLDRFDRKTGVFRHFKHRPDDPKSLSSDLVTGVLVDSQGTLFVGSDGGGLEQYDASLETFRTFQNDPSDPLSLSQDVVRSLFEDRQGQLWVGTYLGGVNLLRKPRHEFGYHTHDPRDPSSLSAPWVQALCEDRRGDLWVATAGGWLHRFDRDKGVFVPFKLPPGLPGTLSIHEDRRGRLWIGTYRGGLARFDPEKGVTKLYRHDAASQTSLSDDQIWAIAEDDLGALWLATNENVDRFDPDTGKVTDRFSTPMVGSTSNPGARALLFDRQGDLWIGTLGGLHLLRKDSHSVRRIKPEDQGLIHNGAVSLQLDSDGRIWIGTYGGGLKCFDPATQALTSYKVEAEAVLGIQEDEEGHLWLSTNHGLAHFDPRHGTTELFDLSNGLESLQFNLGVSLKTRDGHLLFGSTDGFYLFDPKTIKPDTFAPPVVLTGLKIFNEQYLPERALPSLDAITLSYKDKVIGIEFAALDFTLPRRNEYQYRMVGFRDEWLTIEGRRDVTFTNLDPGSYEFQVKASNADGVWPTQRPLTLRVTIEPPWWETLLVRGLGAAALVIVALLAYSRHIQKVSTAVEERTREEVLARKAEERYRTIFEDAEAELRATLQRSQMMSAMGMLVAGVAHEVRNPLFGISANLDTIEARLDALQAKLGADRALFGPVIGRMRGEVDRLATLMQELLDYGKPLAASLSRESLKGVLLEAIQACSEMAADAGVRLVEDISHLPSVAMDRSRLLQVFVNLLQNAIQHSPAGSSVAVEGRPHGDKVSLRVADSGPGFLVEDLPHVFEPFFTRRRGGTGLGLAIVQQIVEAHGGTVVAANRPEGGAVLSVVLPVATEKGPPPTPPPSADAR